MEDTTIFIKKESPRLGWNHGRGPVGQLELPAGGLSCHGKTLMGDKSSSTQHNSRHDKSYPQESRQETSSGLEASYHAPSSIQSDCKASLGPLQPAQPTSDQPMTNRIYPRKIHP